MEYVGHTLTTLFRLVSWLFHTTHVVPSADVPSVLIFPSLCSPWLSAPDSQTQGCDKASESVTTGSTPGWNIYCHYMIMATLADSHRQVTSVARLYRDLS